MYHGHKRKVVFVPLTHRDRDAIKAVKEMVEKTKLKSK